MYVVTDCGQMSAWYLFNALGFYPVNPASAEYMIGSPIFDKVEISLPQSDHKLSIIAAGAREKLYVENLMVDGQYVQYPIISHKNLLSSSSITFTMNHLPQQWGSDLH